MRSMVFFAVCIVLAAPWFSPGQENRVDESREFLRQHSFYFSYPGVMLFHTGFHRTLTTRYLLLKSAKKCSALERYLGLDPKQLEHIDKLRPVSVESPGKERVQDPNSQPDELVVDSNYYDFLNTEQLARLDSVAFRFDGYASLVRSSVAKRVQLSDESNAEIKAAIAHVRETIFLPRFRSNFASPSKEDMMYREVHFAGAFVTQVNSRIVDLLTDAECERVHEMIVSKIDHDVIQELEKMATLPEGIYSLSKLLTEDELQ